jgi:hypothetical protein
MMLRQRCPRTGVINLFTEADPLLAVGSIVEVGPSQFVWRSHIDDCQAGIARHLPVAEAHLHRALRVRPAFRIIAHAA